MNIIRYGAYKAGKQLAAIDWNYHKNLPRAKTSSGEDTGTRKYNPRTRQWDVKIVKVEKGFQKKRDDVDSVTRSVFLNES